MDLQEAARGAGLPLWQLELLGQDETTATHFVEAVRRGEVRPFMEGVEWDVLEARYQARKRGEKGRFWQRPTITPTFPEVLHLTLAFAPGRSGRYN